MAAAIQTSALTDTVVETCRNLNETDLHLKGQSSAPVTVLDKGGRGSHFLFNALEFTRSWLGFAVCFGGAATAGKIQWMSFALWI